MLARPRVRSSGLVLLGAACGVLPVAAQTQLEVAPYMGRYRPTTILGSGDGVPSDAGDTVKHLSSATWGIRVTKWWPSRVGIEARVGYAPSSLWSSLAYTSPVYPAHVVIVSAIVLRRLTRPAARSRFHVGGGLGLVGHGGYAYPSSGYSGPRTFLGGIANVGGLIKLSGPVGLRFDAEDFVYAAHLGPCTRTGPGSGSVCDVFGENAGRSTGSRLQNDIVLSLGFAFTMSRTAQPGAL
jgi:hypothetical protein